MNKERALLMMGTWLALYPTVTLVSYLVQPTDWPLFVKTFVTTILTVPLITFGVVPRVKSMIGKAEDKPAKEVAED